MECRFPGLRHGAARLEAGSEVLGFDTPVSVDHGWGPHVTLFVSTPEWTPELAAEVRRVMADELPFEFRGYPTHFTQPWSVMTPTTERPINHGIRLADAAGDEVGSLVITGRLVRDVMRLGFLMERQYAPYAKWFGSAFARLACAPRLLPPLRTALTAPTWQERDRHLGAAYEIAAELHNALGITPPLDTRPHLRYPTRPYTGITASRFDTAIVEQIRDEPLRRLAERRHGAIGTLEHWIDSTDALSGDDWRRAYRRQYRDALSPAHHPHTDVR